MTDNIPTLDVTDVDMVAEHLSLPREEAQFMVETQLLAQELSEADPSLSYTALIIAQDRIGAKRWWADAETGKVTWERAVNLTGSYARFGQALRAVNEGHLSKDWLCENIANLWAFSDPDDTEPLFLAAWKDVGSRGTIFDGSDEKPNPGLPDGVNGLVTVYRGQDRGATVGIAFTTQLATAEKFARGAGLRQSSRNGVVLAATVPREKVLAYLTDRGEAETIVDPSDLTFIEDPLDGGLAR